MAFVWLFTIWFAPPLLLQGFVAYVRRRTLTRVGSWASITKYLLTSTSDHAAFATQGAALTLFAADAAACPAPIVALGAGLTFAFCLAYMALDVALFVQGGLRMQWQFVAFTSALKDFARGKAWGAQAAGIAGLAAVVCLVCAWASLVQIAHRGRAPDWQMLPAVGVAMTLSALARRTLPVFFMYEWTNPVIAVQIKALMGLLHKFNRQGYGQLRNSQNVPKALVPQCERSSAANAAYPLLRQVKSFEGTRHIELARKAGGRCHVVCVFLESFRAADVGALGSPHKVTPHFDALCNEGILWSRFYATGTYTAPALTAALFGVLPRFAGSSLQMHMPPIWLYGLPHLFAKRGYATGFFSDGPMDWENKREFFLRNGFAAFFGPPSLLEAYPDAVADQWNFDDAYLMRFHANWLSEQEAAGRPSFSALLTVTNHHPFAAPPHAPAPNVGDQVRVDSDYYKYLRTTQYTDACLGAYIAELKARGLYDKTVFVIMGDHGQQVTFEQKMDWSGQYQDSGVRVPLLLVAPGLLPGGKIIKELGSQVDVLPTLMDLFGFDGAHHACGTSLLRRCDTRQAITLHPWKPGLYVTRFGDFRYVHSLETGVAALYDIARDPQEQQDVSGQYPELFAAQKQQVALLRDYLEALYTNNSIVPQAGDTRPSGPQLPRRPSDALSAPQSLADVQGLIDKLGQDKRASGSQAPIASLLMGAYRLGLAAVWMPEAQRLRAVHLMGHRLRRVHTGEMTNAERAELSQLLQRLTHPPAGHALPHWLQDTLPSFVARFS